MRIIIETVVDVYLVAPFWQSKLGNVILGHKYVIPNRDFQKRPNDMWIVSENIDSSSCLQFQSVQIRVDLSIGVGVLWIIGQSHKKVLLKPLRQPVRVLIVTADPSAQQVCRA